MSAEIDIYAAAFVPATDAASRRHAITDRELLQRILAVLAGGAVNSGSGLPYGADSYAVAYYGSTNNIHTLTFSRAGDVVATRTFTYAASGAADDDKLTASADTLP